MSSAHDPEAETAIFPPALLKRPTFEQVLKQSMAFYQQQTTLQGNVQLPLSLLDGLKATAIDPGSAENRKKLYQGQTGIQIFDPAETEKQATETMMKAFVAELKAKRPSTKMFRQDNSKKTFEDAFLDEYCSGKHVHNMHSVIAEVNMTWTDWQNRSQTMQNAKGYFRQFCETLNNYSAIFELLPSDNMYTSTLYGATKLLVKASADYEAMAEGFARAMAEIGVELINAKDLQALYNTDEMLRAVVALYTHVMRFLLFSMRWCKKYGSGRRFLSCFTEGGYWSKGEEHLQTIKTLAAGIRNIAQKAQYAENRNEHLSAERARRQAEARGYIIINYLQSIFDQQRRTEKRLDNMENANPKPIISRLSRKSITGIQSEVQSSAHNRALLGEEHLNYPPTSSESATQSKPSIAKREKTSLPVAADEIPLIPTSFLPIAQNVFGDQIAGIDVNEDLRHVQSWHCDNPYITPKTADRISDWLKSADASMIWIRGHIRSQRLSNSISGLAANLISAAQLSQTPVLFFFCGLNIRGGRSARPTFEILMSLVLQALKWPKELESRKSNAEEIPSFSKDRILKARSSLKELWALFKEVLELLPQPPMIVIDLLDVYHSYETEIARLIERLVGLVPDFGTGERGEHQQRAYKILVTSKGYSAVLEDEIPEEAVVDIAGPTKRLGRGRMGMEQRWPKFTKNVMTSSEDEGDSLDSLSLSDADGGSSNDHVD